MKNKGIQYQSALFISQLTKLNKVPAEMKGRVLAQHPTRLKHGG